MTLPKMLKADCSLTRKKKGVNSKRILAMAELDVGLDEGQGGIEGGSQPSGLGN